MSNEIQLFLAAEAAILHFDLWPAMRRLERGHEQRECQHASDFARIYKTHARLRAEGARRAFRPSSRFVEAPASQCIAPMELIGSRCRLPGLSGELIGASLAQCRKANAAAGVGDASLPQLLSSCGTLPPFSASLIMTCLCSQMFIAAESFMSPLYFSSWASCLRAARLLSRSSSFIRSTNDVRQLSFCLFCAARAPSTAATSTAVDGAADAPAGAAVAAVDAVDAAPVDAAPVDAGADVVAGGAGAALGAADGSAALASADLPKIADMMFPKILIIHSLG